MPTNPTDDVIEQFRVRFADINFDLPANPIVDELQDLIEDMLKSLRSAREDTRQLRKFLAYLDGPIKAASQSLGVHDPDAPINVEIVWRTSIQTLREYAAIAAEEG